MSISVGIWERAKLTVLAFSHKDLDLLKQLYLRFMIQSLLDYFLSAILDSCCVFPPQHLSCTLCFGGLFFLASLQRWY